jgi:hypothetical protein
MTKKDLDIYSGIQKRAKEGCTEAMELYGYGRDGDGPTGGLG